MSRSPRFSTVVAALLAAGVLPAIADADHSRNGPEDPEQIVVVSERALYGFPVDEESVARARDDQIDDWGTPLTVEESNQLQARSDFVARVAGSLGLAEQTLGWFAGARLEHTGDGRIALYTTDEAAAADWIAKEFAADTASKFDVELVSSSWHDLQRATSEVMERRSLVVDGQSVSVHSVAIDGATNSLVAFSSQIDEPMDSRHSGLDVRVIPEDIPSDDACTSRTNCTPSRGGIQIRRGSTSGALCTYGFTVYNPSTQDRELWTAGHCGFTGSNNWYHAGNAGSGFLGAETYIGDYTAGSKDYMRVEVANSALLNIIFRSESVAGWEWPVQNGPICASLGASFAYDCGTVRYSAYSWVSSTNGRTMHGARHQSISTMGGDSGSPIFRDAGSTFVANGIHNTSAGGFTRVWDIVGPWYPG